MFNPIPTLPNLTYFVHRFFMYMAVEQPIGCTAIKWKPEPHLQRNINLYQIQHEQFAALCDRNDESGIVQFWLDIALNDLPSKQTWEPQNRVEKAWEHLSLYCEESCYRAASQVWKENQYKSWEEYIFFARCLVYDSGRFRAILAKYDPSQASLYTYMTEVLRKTIKDESAVSKFSKWRLLCKRSNKELKEALFRYGRFEPEISRFLFARKYFKQVYQFNKIQNSATRSSKRWIEPDIHDFQAAAQSYNLEKLLAIAPHQVAVGQDITGEQIQDWMEICITALRNYPHSITPCISLELMSACGQEINVDNEVKQELESSISEPSIIWQCTESILKENLLMLNEAQQEILYLYYGLRWSQKKIAAKFAVTQGAIAHRLQTIERKLINTVYSLKQPPKWVERYIQKWLQYNYETPDSADLIHTVLVAAVSRLNYQSQNLLRLYYGQKFDMTTISKQLHLTPNIVSEVLHQTHCELETVLLQEINLMLKKFINIWLIKKYNYINSLNISQKQLLLSDT